MGEQSQQTMYKCAHCGLDLRDPKNAGFIYNEEWFCSHLHAYIHTGHAGIEVTNDQLTRYVP